MKVKKEDMKAADFSAVVAAFKRDIESKKHGLHALDPNKYIHETRDDMDIISIVIEDKDSSDKESSNCESSSASASSSGLPHS
eukprot:13832661-Ditylum_brightwellii.AAC.1